MHRKKGNKPKETTTLKHQKTTRRSIKATWACVEWSEPGGDSRRRRLIESDGWGVLTPYFPLVVKRANGAKTAYIKDLSLSSHNNSSFKCWWIFWKIIAVVGAKVCYLIIAHLPMQKKEMTQFDNKLIFYLRI